MMGMLTPHGRITIAPVDVQRDAALLHEWLTSPHAAFWGAQQASVDDIAAEYRRIASSKHESAWIVSLNGSPSALVETYDPARVLLDAVPGLAHQSGDIGMHILVSPPTEAPLPGYTSSIFAGAMRWLIDERRAQRVLVEPDANNHKIIAKNALAGFQDYPALNAVQIQTAGHAKTARIQYCNATSFQTSVLAGYAAWESPAAVSEPKHLLSNALDQANRQLIAKAIREFSHERLLAVEPIPPQSEQPTHQSRSRWYQAKFGSTTIEFQATSHALDHLSIPPDSLRFVDATGKTAPLPMLPDLVTEASDVLQITPKFLHTYLEELQATLAARARVLERDLPTARQLSGRDLPETLTPRLQADHLQFVEASMMDGHPGFVANSGRGGMSESDLRRWAPELAAAGAIVWLAAHRSCCICASSADVFPDAASQSAFWEQQLGPTLWKQFTDAILTINGDPAEYVPIPVHEWQWEHRITTTFASDLAERKLLWIGESTDLYRPQQSLRTFFNHSRPTEPYVKTAIAVRNMGFLRGLSSNYMDSTPAINDWLQQTLGTSSEFAQNKVVFLREIATVGYTADVYHRSVARTSSSSNDHTKMLAGLWRESPIGFLESDELAVTLASVLHVDANANTLVREWIEQSGVQPQEWLRNLLDVYLWPVVHALASNNIVFMPHGENVILRLRNGLPVGSFFKDLGEEVAVVDKDQPIPTGLERIQADNGDMDNAQRALSIHTDVLDGVLRHLAALMADHGLLTDTDFWAVVRECIEDYESSHPGTLDRLPLFSQTFRLSCLNRLQLRNPLTMVNLGDQNSSLIYSGDLRNPLAN